MKKKNPFSWKELACLGIATMTLAGGCMYITNKLGLEPDSPVEEVTEVVINTVGESIVKKLTGLDIDLDVDITPDSPER